MTAAYHDYLFKFSDLPRALEALAALRAAGIMGHETIPQNMLGEPRDSSGAYTTDEASVAWVGRAGIPATSYVDENGQTVDVPAVGDPTMYYVAIRSSVPPSKVPVDPASYGLETCSAAESAAVLGVWA